MLSLKKISLFLLLPFCFASLFLSGCGESELSDDKTNVLNLGTCGDNPPFEYHDTSHGEDVLVGADIDLAQALAQELGMKLEIHDLEFNSLIPSLQAGRVDFVMALMTPTEERRKNVAFSDHYLMSRIAIVFTKNVRIKNEKDLAGKKIGVQLGSTNEQTAKELASRIAGLEIISLNKLGELILDVRAGRLDGVMMEATPAKAYTDASDDLNYSVIESLQSNFAIAFAKDSPWVEKFNKALKKLKAEGKLDEILSKWIKK